MIINKNDLPIIDSFFSLVWFMQKQNNMNIQIGWYKVLNYNLG